ncbi:MAG: hypothetical protein U1F16_15580 [Turneriella sp.]
MIVCWAGIAACNFDNPFYAHSTKCILRSRVIFQLQGKPYDYGWDVLMNLFALRTGNFGFFLLMFVMPLPPLNAVQKLASEPVIIKDNQPDEKGNKPLPKPVIFSVFLGSYALTADPVVYDNAKSLATTNIMRSDEIIYKGSGASLSDASEPVTIAPALRFAWDIPFERVAFLPSWHAFSLALSFEGVYSPEKNILSSSGNFRYQNAQATHVALTDVTYTGALTVTERHYALAPMLGVSLALTNATLQKAAGLTFVLGLGGGVLLQSGQRNYDLALNSQYISAGTYSDTYAIGAKITQAYSMAVLPAGRADLGIRFRTSARTHLMLVITGTFVYGILPYDNYGTFFERAGSEKYTYQKVITGYADQDVLAIRPAVFLALSTEL